MAKKHDLNRRQFFTRATGAVAFPYIVSSAALGRAGTVAPGNKITVGCIGMGGMGNANLNNFIVEKDVQVVAVCDVDGNHLQAAIDRVNNHYGNKDCKGYRDFRELLARNDIDAVSIALPDHWHGVVSVMAANRGMDIYGEKPISHNLREGRAICDAVKRNGVIWQTGSWQRSVGNFRFACELVKNGTIGKVHTVHVGLPGGPGNSPGPSEYKTAPDHLDYDMWVGPAPKSPYTPSIVHFNWRWNYDFGGGQLLDWIGHHCDIAHWGLGLDYSGPVEIEGTGDFLDGPIFNVAKRYRVHTTYANGVKMILSDDNGEDIKMGTKWIGDKGWVWVSRSGIDANPKELLDIKFGPNDINLYRSPGHQRNFLDCVKSRKTTLTPAEIAHRSATPGHLGIIAMKLGRKLTFNPETEEIVGDEMANRMLGRPMRSPWTL